MNFTLNEVEKDIDVGFFTTQLYRLNIVFSEGMVIDEVLNIQIPIAEIFS